MFFEIEKVSGKYASNNYIHAFVDIRAYWWVVGTIPTIQFTRENPCYCHHSYHYFPERISDAGALLFKIALA